MVCLHLIMETARRFSDGNSQPTSKFLLASEWLGRFHIRIQKTLSLGVKVSQLCIEISPLKTCANWGLLIPVLGYLPSQAGDRFSMLSRGAQACPLQTLGCSEPSHSKP